MSNKTISNRITGLQLSPKALVVNTSRKCTRFECWSFFHVSITERHFIFDTLKPAIMKVNMALLHELQKMPESDKTKWVL